VLALIAERPAVRAPDLAPLLGLDTVTFKRDVRKLKELGLTESLTVGYRISPRGLRVADSFGADGSPGPENAKKTGGGQTAPP
jgi:DNA-binding IclR family transcriptional regulator